MSEQKDPQWEVSIEAWGPDDAEGETRWQHYLVSAPDEDTAKEKGIKRATKPGIDAIIGISDDYNVYDINGPYDL
jgi:hypothetical protein